MSDWLVIRIPLNNPNEPEVVEALSNVPVDWKEYLEKVAAETKKPGRYLATNILYNAGDAFYPKTAEAEFHKTEDRSQ